MTSPDSDFTGADNLTLGNAVQAFHKVVDVKQYFDDDLPGPLDHAVDALVHAFAKAGLAERTQYLDRDAFSDWERQVLITYGRQMATLAVRTSEPGPVERGFVALVLEGCQYDERENIITSVLLMDAATRLGLDSKALFRYAASLAPRSKGAEFAGEFLERDAADNSLEAMGYRPGRDGGGFLYERDPAIWGA